MIEVVEDELCPWNNACYRLAVTDDGTEVEKLAGRVSPDLAIGPEGLASLVTGHTRATDLARMGRAAIPDVGRAPVLDALFSTRRRPHCPNMF